VAWNAKVWNRLNLLTRWQALEYIVSQNLDRRAFAVLNCITVVPGAVWAWRRDLVMNAWGFSGDTLAEDSDLTIAIRKMWYEIAYEEDAYGITEAPDTVSAFVRQRYRWMFGTFQAVWKHHDAVFRPKYGWLWLFALPNILLYQIVFPLISPIIDILTIISIITAVINRIMHGVSYSADNIKQILFYYALFLLVDYITWLIAFFLEKKEDKKLLVWLFLQRFFYRQLMYLVAIKSIVASLKWHEVGWNKLERKATVKFEW
jgi:cellulose synthase/poly-beta-1,6-N-acetylglucosamine synthase-like glycosyltransferase